MPPPADAGRGPTEGVTMKTTSLTVSRASQALRLMKKRSPNVLNVEDFRTEFKRLRLTSRSYKQLLTYLLLFVGYMVLVGVQHNTVLVGGVASAWRTAIERPPPISISISSPAAVFVYLQGAFLDMTYGKPFTHHVVRHGKNSTLTGYQSMQSSYLMGGVAVTAIHNSRKECFRGQACYSEPSATSSLVSRPSDMPENITVGQLIVPYDLSNKGYTAFLPGFSKSLAAQVITELQTGKFFNDDVSEMKLSWVSMMPSGEKAISLNRLGITRDTFGYWAINLETFAMPYHLYPDISVAGSLNYPRFVIRVILELALLFVVPLVLIPLLLRLARAWWAGEVGTASEVFPMVRDGTIPWVLALLIQLLLVFSSGLWASAVFIWARLNDFGSDKLDFMFTPIKQCEDPNATDICYTELRKRFAEQVNPFLVLVEHAGLAHHLYFTVASVLIMLMTLRLFDYLTFQKRLSMISDTFKGIGIELAHLGVVLIIVVFAFSLSMQHGFGNEDPYYQTLAPDFFENFMQCFGLFKPGATMVDESAFFKYTPHVDQSGFDVHFWPLILNIAFKIIVFMLLFKFLFAMINESYKKNHTGKRKKSVTVSEEVGLIYRKWWDDARMFRGTRPFVSMKHIAQAIKSESGTQGETTVPTMLTADKLLELLKKAHQAGDLNDRTDPYDEEDVGWALDRWGQSKVTVKAKQRKRAFDDAAKKAKEKGEIKCKCGGVFTTPSMIFCPQCGSKRVGPAPTEKIKKDKPITIHPSEEAITEAFSTVDKFGDGAAEMLDVMTALKQLGYRLDEMATAEWNAILDKYDDDENCMFEMREFSRLVKSAEMAPFYEGGDQPSPP